jgi:hypothetical protein
MQGLKVWARRIGQKTLDGVNQGGAGKLGQWGIDLGSELADGREGFVALAWLDDAAMPSRSLAAEGFLDPRGQLTSMRTARPFHFGGLR